jgi:pimeloyl-ACP methyl ester carboxylesterase
MVLMLLLSALALLLVVKSGSYLLRWYDVTGEPGFDPGGPARRAARVLAGLAPFLGEYLASLAVYGVWCVETPLRLLLRPFSKGRPALPADPGARPVILVHGFFTTPWSMGFLWLDLRRRGVGPLHLLDYHPALGPIERFAAQLAALVERVAGPDGQVDVIAHSMGGLVAARYARDHPRRVANLVALGTPFHGTRLWAMSVGASLPQMRPGSAFLAETVERDGFPGPTRLTSIYSRFEQIVLPCRSSRVDKPGVANVELGGLGHNALLLSPRVARRVAAALGHAPEVADRAMEPAPPPVPPASGGRDAGPEPGERDADPVGR